jgi:hypothetical protein
VREVIAAGSSAPAGARLPERTLGAHKRSSRRLAASFRKEKDTDFLKNLEKAFTLWYNCKNHRKIKGVKKWRIITASLRILSANICSFPDIRTLTAFR